MLQCYNLHIVGDKKNLRICSRHFTDHQYQNTIYPSGNCSKRLRSDAVPDVIPTVSSSKPCRFFQDACTQTDVIIPPYAEEDTVSLGLSIVKDLCKRKYDFAPTTDKLQSRVKRQHVGEQGDSTVDSSSCIETIERRMDTPAASPTDCSWFAESNNDDSTVDISSCIETIERRMDTPAASPTDYSWFAESNNDDSTVDISSCIETIESRMDTPAASPTDCSWFAESNNDSRLEMMTDLDIFETTNGETTTSDDEAYETILRSLEESTSSVSDMKGYSVVEESHDKSESKSSHPFSHLGPAVNIDYITEDELHYLTGFSSAQFKYILCLTEKQNQNNWPCCMSLKNQLQLSLIKLRLNSDYRFLSILFRVSQQMASKIFKYWLDLLDNVVNAIDFWNLGVKGENLYRAVVDCSEFIIEKPSQIIKQQITWSTYKHRNTFKVLVAIDENGTVIFVSPLFGGAASDDKIVEKSGILDHLQRGDHVLADRGFETSDNMAEKGIILNKPPSKSGNQLSEVDVANTRAIASRRVEVERIIGLAKDNRILTQKISHCLFPLADKIVNVVFKLTNFKKPICKEITK